MTFESFYDDSSDELQVAQLMAFMFAGNDYLTSLAGRDTLTPGTALSAADFVVI